MLLFLKNVTKNWKFHKFWFQNDFKFWCKKTFFESYFLKNLSKSFQHFTKNDVRFLIKIWNHFFKPKFKINFFVEIFLSNFSKKRKHIFLSLIFAIKIFWRFLSISFKGCPRSEQRIFNYGQLAAFAGKNRRGWNRWRAGFCFNFKPPIAPFDYYYRLGASFARLFRPV